MIQAINSLDYRPSQAARALASARTKMLGILASDTDFSGPASMVHAMEAAARDQGYFTVICGIDPADKTSVKDGVAHLRRLGVEGIAVISPHDEVVEEARANLTGVPLITLDSMYSMDGLAVSVDNFAGGAAATQHLIDLGHQKILHVSGPKNWFESSTRAAGYTSTMLAAGLEPVIVDGDWSISTGFALGMQFDFAAKRITAVFLANDRMALGLLHACRIRGISVPEQLSVVGFDDLEETEYCWPPLTTLRQDFKTLGQRAMNLLLQELDGRAIKKSDRLVPELVVRESTQHPPEIR